MIGETEIPTADERLAMALQLARMRVNGQSVYVFPSCWPTWPDGPDGAPVCGDGGNSIPHTGRDIGKAPLPKYGHLAAVTPTDNDPKVNEANERTIRYW